MDFFTTTEFMTELGLDLREQTAFAIIYTFSQGREGCWFGSIASMSKWLGNCTKATTIATLKKLTDKGLIEKEEYLDNGVKRCRYFTGIKIKPGWYKNYTGGGIKIIPNNDIDKSISKNNNKRYNISRFDFYTELLSLGVSEQTAKDWMEVRKAKRGVNTRTAFDDIRREISKAGESAEDCIRFAVAQNWCGFKAEWLANATAKRTSPQPPSYQNNKPTISDMARKYGIIPNANEYNPDEQ